jgi:serine O-acetyltransferase
MLIFEDLRCKAKCYGRPGALASMFLVDGTSAMILYRMSSLCARRGLGALAFLLRWANSVVNGCWIGRNARFGPGFVIMHPQGVVINSGVRGGSAIVLQAGVVIGTERDGRGEKAPRLGSGIAIGAGAKIIGDITVGDNVVIGANTVVVQDVPSGSTVVGMPGRPVAAAGCGQSGPRENSILAMTVPPTEELRN